MKNYLSALKNAIICQAAKSKSYAKTSQDCAILQRISNLSNQLEVNSIQSNPILFQGKFNPGRFKHMCLVNYGIGDTKHV